MQITNVILTTPPGLFVAGPYAGTEGVVTAHINGHGVLIVQYVTAALGNLSLGVALRHQGGVPCSPNCQSPERLSLPADLIIYVLVNGNVQGGPAYCENSEIQLTVGGSLLLSSGIPQMPVSLSTSTTGQWWCPWSS